MFHKKVSTEFPQSFELYVTGMTDPYILHSTQKSPDTAAEAKIDSPNGDVPSSFVYKQSQVQAEQKKGGWCVLSLPFPTPMLHILLRVKIADSTNFNASKEVASALVSVEPGGLRELHW
jgi:oxalate decarboxylase